MMSTGEVARGIGVTERTVRRWCEAGFRVLVDGSQEPVSARRMDGRAWLIDAAPCWCGELVLLAPLAGDKEVHSGQCSCGIRTTTSIWRRGGKYGTE
jgi:predicted transcriptional regulator